MKTTVNWFPRLGAVLLALARERDRMSTRHPSRATNAPVLHAALERLSASETQRPFITLQPDGVTVGWNDDTSADGLRRQCFEWEIRSANEAREVLIARDLWSPTLDEWRGSRPAFLSFPSGLKSRPKRHVEPTLREVVALAAMGSRMTTFIARAESTLAPAHRFERLVFRARGLLRRSGIPVGVRSALHASVISHELLIQFAAPWSYGAARAQLLRCLMGFSAERIEQRIHTPNAGFIDGAREVVSNDRRQGSNER